MAKTHDKPADVATLQKRRRELEASYRKAKATKAAGYSGIGKRLHSLRVALRKKIIALEHRIRHLRHHSGAKLGEAIDVSYAQPHVDWSKVGDNKPPIRVGFRKGTEGSTFQDPSATKSEFADMQRHVVTFIYHFCRPDNNDPEAEVANVKRKVEALGLKVISYADAARGKEGVVILVDFETAPYSTSWISGFAAAVRKAFGIGWGSVLYGGGYSLDPVLGAIKYFAGVMIAGYPNYQWEGPDSVLLFHQFTDRASVPGCPEAVDESHYLGG